MRSFSRPGRLPPALIRHMASVGMAAVFLGLFVRVTLAISHARGAPTLDATILSWLGGLRRGWLNQTAIDITALGSTAVVTLFSVIGLAILLLTKDRRDAVHLLLAAATSGLWTEGLKRTIERPRPEVIPRLAEATGYSYPSGHALTAAAMYLTLTIIGCRYVRTRAKQVAFFSLSTFVIVLIGLSRVYLGVHFPSDVLSGIAFGAAWALLLGAAFSTIANA